MSAGLTSISSVEIEDYCEAVRIALADLSPEIRDDLLEDLPDHLREVLAEGDGSLRDRLGEPVDYARELRSAVGLDATDAAPNSTSARLRATLADAVRRAKVVADRSDRRLGRLLGYPRLVDLAQAIRPGWWVLRGWIVAQLLCGIGSNYLWRGFIPNAGNSQFRGAVITVVAIIASIWLGRWSLRFSPWPRALMAALSVAVAVWAITVLADNVSGGGRASYVMVPSSIATPAPAATSAPPSAAVPTPGALDSPAPSATG